MTSVGIRTDGLPRAPINDSVWTWSQPLVTTILLVASLITMPRLGTGLGAYALVLLALSTLHGYSRSLPDRWLPGRARLLLAVPAAVVAGLLVGVASGSWAVSFGYLLAGHAGFRLRARAAAAVACLDGGVAALMLAVGPHLGSSHWPWWTGLTMVAPVITGLGRQNRLQTIAYAAELVETTRRAAASEAEAGALAERNRIARELHDVLAHALSGVSVQLDTADALLEAGRVDDGRAGLQRARELVVEGLVQARGAVTTLRDDDVDLAAALTGSVHGEERLVVTGDLSDVPSPVARVVLRLAQEGLTNARRHAPGAATLVEVDVADGALRLAITNGAPPALVPAFALGSGQGLVGMRERVAGLGGTIEAGPHAGGWRVAVRLPLDGPHG